MIKKKSKLNICFIVEGYPIPDDPYMPFIKNVVGEMAKQGVNCTVIAPQSITRAIKHKVPIRPKKWIDTIDESATVNVLQPIYISLSGKMRRFNQSLFIFAAKNVYRKLDQKPSVLYAHFWHMGVVASKIDSTVPLFVACGESKISVRDEYKDTAISRMQKQLSGVIYVSSKSYKESVNLGLQCDNPYIIAPNGYDPLCFKKISKAELREKKQIKMDEFVVCYVGAFNERKGARRLQSALSILQKKYTNISAIYIGKGSDEPSGEGILFKGSVPHESVVEYLCASDVFVLPTKNEGCCNAIVEAIACGLPVISSKESFNDDILDEHNSIRVDSNDVAEIAEAIERLYLCPTLLGRLREGAAQKAETLSIVQRAEGIEQFIRTVCNEN